MTDSSDSNPAASVSADGLVSGKRYVFYRDAACQITHWRRESRVDVPRAYYLESGWTATHWAPLPEASDARWQTTDPWYDPDAFDVDVLTLVRTPEGRLKVVMERKRPESRRDVNHPVFAGALKWMRADVLRAQAQPLPDTMK